ncbi:hypothetical protein FISHEDRAFT_55798 [Fistulina hepatica ATCC 64428]|uniref:DUF7770 domain-containing protein n=1 Tax=Fistulina hepatica ATCC 64428 TaxID=1128425 RepID=A0A0D7AM12_9AGAR|nr:hypothetical protein FISHEDRAFT_55798 [Fistulina hepatica ATCC 64428]
MIVGIYNGTVFHFHLSFVLEDNSSICLDPSPAGLDLTDFMRIKVVLDWKDRPAPVVAKHCDSLTFMAIKPDVTIGDVLKAIFGDKKLDNYRFDDDGRGCRYWCIVVLQELAAVGLIDPVDDIIGKWEAEQAIKYAPVFYPNRYKGTFF